MSKLARMAAVTAVAAVLTGGAFMPSASANGSHSYTCSNQGGGPNHTVNCIGTITVNNVLNNTTVVVKDVNVLNGTQLNTLQNALVNVSNNDVNAPVSVQIGDLQTAVITTYLQNFSITVLPVNISVCDGSICV
ncbi:preprotein translocase subunit TatB [Streptomyces sp. NPDC005209]|uniref:preprotein translocase subunit TatB n=1 Tax=Streptomyces sp. NPDC005209 TaxID=3156715 RepID=UPI0033AEBFBB